MTEERLKALLGELEAEFANGVVALSNFPADETNVYLWWGSRTYGLGLTSRLDDSINYELSDLEEGTDESGAIEADVDEPSTDLAKEFPQLGQYL